MKKIVAVIPARGGSKGILRKNIINLCGKPLVAYAIESAKASEYIDEVYVSTEDCEIAGVAEKFGARVIKRPLELATDEATSADVLLHAANVVDFDVLVFLQCTAPLTTSQDIDGILKKYFEGYDSVLSVCHGDGGFLCSCFNWDENGNSVNYDYRKRPRRQNFGTIYRENGALYVVSREKLLEHKNWLCGKIGLYVMPHIRSFEVDETEDLEMLRMIFPIISDKAFSGKNF